MTIKTKKNIEISQNGSKKTFFSLFRKRETETEIAVWRHFALNIFPHNDSLQGYNEMFGFLKKIIQVPAFYLYLTDAEKKKLILTHSDLADLKNWAEENQLDDRTEAELREPEIVIQYRKEFQAVSVIEMLGADLLNIPLRLKGNEYLGTILCGPLLKQSKIEKYRLFFRVFSVAAANAVKRYLEIDNLREEVNALQQKMKVSKRMLGSALELNRFVELLLDLALTATRAEAGFVAMLDKKGESLSIRAHKNLPEEFVDKINLSAEDGLFDWSIDSGNVMILRDYDFIEKFKVKSILAVPLREAEKLLGIFALINFQSNEMFNDFSLNIITNFTEQIRLVLNNSRLFEDFTNRYFSTLVAMSEAYDHRSAATTGHSRRVADLAVRLAKKMNLEPEKFENIYQAGLIHDVGMCGVVDIGEDFQADFNHPEIAANMIEVLPVPSELTEGIRTHHEWYDGWGFPNGLKGEQIPIEGRILAVAEYFAEATTNTKFKESLDISQLKEELELRKGKQFDPAVVDALNALLEEKEAQDLGAMYQKCWIFKGEPQDVCANCPAYQSKEFCWLKHDVNCAAHGDETCERCFLFKEWINRVEKYFEDHREEVKKMEHKIEKREGYVLLRLQGEIDVSVAPQLRNILKNEIENGNGKLLIDLSEVPFIDSSGLGIFVVGLKMATARNGAIRFAGARPEVMKVIKLTGLDKHFQLFESLEQAEQEF